jgi:Polysaccharide lyase
MLTNFWRHILTSVVLWLVPAAGAAACPLMYCTVDLDLSAQIYSGCETFADCLKFDRTSVKWASWRDGHYSSFNAGQPAITDFGLLVESDATNYVLYSRDLTNPAWRKANIAVTKFATGIDNAPRSASTLTATGANGVVSQAISLPEGQRSLSLFMRRRTGVGLVSISYDGGATFMPCALTHDFQRFSVASEALTNPEVVIRLQVEGDSVDVDFVQLEGDRVVTSPILTEGAPVGRTADHLSVTGKAVELLNTGTFSFLVEGEGTAPRTLNRTPAEIIGGQTASFFIVPILSKLVFVHHGKLDRNLYASLGWGISSLMAQGGMAKHFRFAASSSDAGGISLVGDDGAMVRDATGFGQGNGPWQLGGSSGQYNGFLTRFTIWGSKLEDQTLQWLTRVDIPPGTIANTELNWKNLAVRDTIDINGVSYEVQSGIQREPVTNTYPTQVNTVGNYMKFNMFANNAWAIDGPDPTDGTERVELSGNVSGSAARFQGPDVASIWMSDSFYIEKGDPITTDWVTLGQIHDRDGLGPVLGFSLRSGAYLSVDIIGEGFAKSIGRYPIARGTWYNRVFSVKFNQRGDGYVRVWINGAKVADYRGSTGNSMTQYYYWKFGIYRSHAPEYLAVRYANTRIGTSDLSALITAPDPLPK